VLVGANCSVTEVTCSHVGECAQHVKCLTVATRCWGAGVEITWFSIMCSLVDADSEWMNWSCCWFAVPDVRVWLYVNMQRGRVVLEQNGQLHFSAVRWYGL